MSGMSNVRFWLAQRKLPATDEVCQRILQTAKTKGWTLSEKEILKLIKPPAAVKRQAKAPAVKKTAKKVSKKSTKKVVKKAAKKAAKKK